MANDKDNEKSSTSPEQSPQMDANIEQNGTKAPEQNQTITLTKAELEQLKKEALNIKINIFEGLLRRKMPVKGCLKKSKR